MKIAPVVAVLTLGSLFAAAGCREREDAAAAAKPAREEAPVPPSNRIDLPATVRQNLGITFAKVERRRVAATVRVPGRFELLPSARREYRATLSGWVNLLVDQYDDVKKGDPIYQMDSPDWHKLRKQLHESRAAIEAATAELAVAEQAKVEAEKAVAILKKRVEALAGVEVRRAELESDLALRRNAVPRLDGEIKVKQAALEEARHDFALELDTAASLLGLSTTFLTQPADAARADDHPEHRMQQWYAISKVGLMVTEAGVVEALHVTNGTWVEANTLVGTVVNPTALRFRATGLQSDLGKLRDGLAAAVVPPQGGGGAADDALRGRLKVGISGDPDHRTIELLVTPADNAAWAKPGVSAMLEVVVDGSDNEELAIPASAVVRDELTHIFFRRDPKDPDKVIRMEADLGVNDGKWVVINSGVKAGDEVVLDGVYELKLAGGGKATGGGHFHADGTWHAESDK
jgi:multidrug efflux pump subunit AcrA (membrane-fusion protein)